MLKKYWFLILILVSGLALRLYHLTKISLWHDEAFSALMIRYPWGEMMRRLAIDVHPPLYYWAVRFWTYVFGDSVFSLRGFSVLCGVNAIYLTYYLVDRYMANRKAALLSALFMAVNFFQILRGSLEARMYTLGVMLGLAATIALLSALNFRGPTKQMWLRYFLFALLGASMIYTHYYLAFNLIALGLYALIYLFQNYRWNWRAYIPFTFSCVLVGVLYLPWFPTFHAQLSQVQEGFWIWAMTRWSIPNTLWDLSFAWHSGIIPTNSLYVLVTIAALVMLVGFVRSVRLREKWLVLLSILAPFAGSLMFLVINRLQGHTSSVYLVRYFVLIGPFYLIAIALWLSTWQKRFWFYAVAGLVVVLNLVAFGDFWGQQWGTNKPGMAGATTYLNKHATRPKDKIIVGTPYEYFNAKYYLEKQPLLYSNGRSKVSEMSHYDGTALLSDQDLAPDFKTVANKEDTVWLVWTRAYSSDKPLVPANWTQVDERGFDDVQPYIGTTIYVTEYKVN